MQTKRPTLLRDVRYFESLAVPVEGDPMPQYTSELFAVPAEATALGLRIARKCEELKVSIGRASHLYLCFTPSIATGEVLPTDYAVDPWHRFVLYGLAPTFNDLPKREKLEVIRNATFECLVLISPEHGSAIAEVRALLERFGDALRICLRRKQTKRYFISVEQTVPVHPKPTAIFLTVTELTTQQTREVALGATSSSDDAPYLVDRLAIVGNLLTIHPRKSFRAQLTSGEYDVPFRVNLAELFRA